jgi:hypothetical protein
MFTPEERARLRSELLDYAAGDARIAGAAITGSVAAGHEDRWSDIDLAFAVAEPAGVPDVLPDWTTYLYDRHRAVHHVDIQSGAWIYRAFLLPSTLQVDLAFVPAAEFRALGPTFRLMFGTAREPRPAATARAADLIGLAWLYAVHVRSSMARRKLWQAEYMISGIRDHALALACVRHGLPTAHGRGVDQLPDAVTAPWEASLVRQLDLVELSRAFQAAVSELLSEIRHADAQTAERLEETLRRLIEGDAESAA